MIGKYNRADSYHRGFGLEHFGLSVGALRATNREQVGLPGWSKILGISCKKSWWRRLISFLPTGNKICGKPCCFVFLELFHFIHHSTAIVVCRPLALPSAHFHVTEAIGQGKAYCSSCAPIGGILGESVPGSHTFAFAGV